MIARNPSNVAECQTGPKSLTSNPLTVIFQCYHSLPNVTRIRGLTVEKLQKPLRPYKRFTLNSLLVKSCTRVTKPFYAICLRKNLAVWKRLERRRLTRK